MIQEETNLIVADNSGAKRCRCIRVLGGSGRKYASVGDTIVVAIKSAIPNGTVKKGEVFVFNDPHSICPLLQIGCILYRSTADDCLPYSLIKTDR